MRIIKGCMMTAVFALMALFMVCLMPSGKASAAEDTFTDQENGVLTVKYNNKDNLKMKIMVTKEGSDKKYSYDLGKGKNELNIPLNLGNGKYTVKILKNKAGTTYSTVESYIMELELTDEDMVYLNSSVMVNYTDTSEAIKKAAELVKKCKTEDEKIKAIYKYIVENYKYDYDKAASVETGYLPDLEVIYKDKKGICYDIASLAAAMMRSQGVKVKLTIGYTPNIVSADGVQILHAWNVIYDASKKSWYTVDATYDLCLFQAKQKYTMKKAAKDYSSVQREY